MPEYQDRFSLLFREADNNPKIWATWVGHATFASGDTDIEYSFDNVLPAVYGSGNLFNADETKNFTQGSFSSLHPSLQSVVSGLLDTMSNTDYRVSFSDVTNVLRFEHITGNGGDIAVMGADIITPLPGSSTQMAQGLGNPPKDALLSKGGDVWLDNLNTGPNASNLQNVTGLGEGGYWLTLHELVHAMGLDHPQDPALNSNQYTVMSYVPSGWHASSSGVGYDPNTDGSAMYEKPLLMGQSPIPLRPYGLQLYDIAALQELYGRNNSMRAGDTVYSMNNGLGREGDAKNAFIYTIWDGGGVDIIDAHGFIGSAKIDLRQGAFSSIGTTGFRADGQESGYFESDTQHREIKNVAIAFHAVVENARGSTDSDTNSYTGDNDLIIGNDWSNVLYGGTGEDRIYGSGYEFDRDHGYSKTDGKPGDQNALPHSDDDVLIGGADNDRLFGGTGNDIIHGDFKRTELNNARSTWNSSHQFDGINDVLVNGFDTADYTRLEGLSIRAVKTTDSNTVYKKNGDTVISTDSLISIESTAGTVLSDAFEGAPTGTSYAYAGNLGLDKYLFVTGTDQGTVHIDDIEGSYIRVAGADNIQIDENFVIKFFPGSGGGSFGPTLLLNPETLDHATGIHRIVLDHGSINTVALWNWFNASGTTGAFGDAAGLNQAIRGTPGDNGTGQGNGVATSDTNGDGSFEFMTVNPGLGGTLLAYANGDEVLHPFVIKNYKASGTGYSADLLTVTKEMSFLDVSLAGVRLTTTGTPGDASLILHVDSLNRTYVIDDFETGKTITGQGMYNVNIHAQVQAMGDNATLAATGVGEYLAQFDSALNFNIGFVSQTYFLELLRFTDGFIDMSEQLTFTGTTANDTLAGLDTRGDVLLGMNGNDVLNGYGGNDTLNGGAGLDAMSGGAGDDLYIIDNVGDTITESSGGTSGIDTVQSSVTYTLATNVEILYLGGTNNINGVGNASNNTLFGNAGINTLDGGTGNDTLDGGAGADTLIGSSGNNTFVIDNAGDVISDVSGVDTIQSYISYTLTSAFENLTLLGIDQINATGSASGNTLIGNAANNTLNGGGGSDYMDGGSGNDLYIIDGGDTVTEVSGGGIDTVQSSVTYTLTAEIENLILTSGALNGTGNSLDNYIVGTSVNNTLSGLDGNDTLDAGSGTDNLIGGLGDDIYIIDGGDTVTEAASAGIDTIRINATYTLLTNFENLVLTGTGSINGTGNTVDNIIVGNSGANSLNGGAGADTLDGGLGADILNGGTGVGNDVFIVDDLGDTVIDVASGGVDTVISSVDFVLGANLEVLTLVGTGAIDGTGNTLANTITGNDAANTLDGDAGNDTLIGGLGADYMIGGTGAGNDIFFVDDAGDVIVENAAGGTDTVNSSVSYTLSANLEHLTLIGADNVNATGNSGANTIIGNDGNNTIDGGGGTDALRGGAGDDAYIIDGSDTITELTDAGTDTVLSSITYTLAANVENLTLTGTSNINGTGTTGNNTFIGNSGNNVFTGLAGDDVYYITGAGTDSIVEAANSGNDTVISTIGFTLGGNVENLTLIGSDVINGTGNTLNNILIGNINSNTLDGGAGNDTLDGGVGIDTLIGGTGTGNDTFIVDHIGDTVIDIANGGTDIVLSSVSFTLVANIENLTLTAEDAINGTGNTLNNTIIGNNASNTLVGDDGVDTLDGRAGADSLNGGNGNDLYIIDNAGDVIYADASGTDLVQSSVSFTLTSVLENLTLTGADNIDGMGHAGNNTINGNSGNNTLNGGGGTDILIGGQGDDTYIIDGSDTITEVASGGIDKVLSSAATYTLAAEIENLTLTGIAAINGTGNALNNTIIGNIASNVLDGGAGNDTIDGGLGADSMSGGTGTGNDTFIVDDVGDTAVDVASGGTDIVFSSVSFTLSTNIENLTLTAVGINGTGNALANALIGAAGVNILTGLNGNDYLDGGEGADTLDGGANNDTYIIDDAGDVILDSAGIDEVRSSVSYVLTSNLEHLTLTGNDDVNGTGNALTNTIIGNAGNNTLAGDNGADLLNGGDGDDYLDGGAGADDMIGGKGDDTFVVDATTDTVTENGGEGTDTIIVSFNYSIASAANIENLTGSAAGAQNLTGNANHNILIGTVGANNLSGADGNDTLIGGDGNDVLTGGNGNDILDSGAGNDLNQNGGVGDDVYIFTSGMDTINETVNGDGIDTLRIAGGVTVDQVDIIISTTDTHVVLNAGVDEMRILNMEYLGANNQNWDIERIAFDDGFITSFTDHASWLRGTVGAETLGGTSAHDTIILMAGNDISNAGDGDDDVHGGAGSDTLTGGNGNDLLHGGIDNDILYGQDGEDVLFGGAGADTFVFETSTAFNNVDFLQDFSTAQNDVIDIGDLLIGYNPGSSNLSDFVQIEEGSNNSILSVDRDGTGTAYDWVRVASINGTADLTNEAALVTSGNLVVT